jgi:hypothetical protein
MTMRCSMTSRAGERPSAMNRSRPALPWATLALCLALGACSGEDDPALEGSMSAPGSAVPRPSDGSPAGAGGSAVGPGVANSNRPLGMPIGQGASGNAPPPVPAPDTPPVATPEEDAAADEELEIPVFVPMQEPPPCTACVEFRVDVDDINQRDNFVFGASATNVTRVVWTLIVPFNSDQLFVQPFVDSAYGTFTDLDANAFAVDTPVQLVHEYSGNAGTVGLAVGSSGAWTGDMTMSVFVDSVTLEGADAAASRTFDADVGGFVVGSNTHNPQIVYHP